MIRFKNVVLLSAALLVSSTATAQQPACTAAQFANDNCEYVNDGLCDAPLECDSGTDCVDCDPCREFDITSCETCTSNSGCSWCGRDAVCVATGVIPAIIANPKITCSSASEFLSDSGSCAAAKSDNFYDDPLFSANSWVYDQINVLPVWKSGITGAGINIRVNDDGVAMEHPDFSSKFDTASSCADGFLPLNREKDDHGTTCAAIAAGSANDACSAGIAPDATLSSCLATGDGALSDSLYYFPPPGGKMDISSNSFGTDACEKLGGDDRRRGLRNLQGSCPFSASAEGSPCLASACMSVDWSLAVQSPECRTVISNYCLENFESDATGCLEFLDTFVQPCTYNTLSPEAQDALIKGVTEGRDGKGIIHVMAAGNEYEIGEVINFEGALNSRFTITVGAVGKLGKHSSYSSTGVALFMSAPGGDFEFENNHVVARAAGGCHNAGVGTSYATPVVTGVVALLLQVNPELGWRDVQGILATTSQKTDPTNPTWTTNGANLHHSILYGFGLVDAFAAVEAAKVWKNVSPERMLLGESGIVDAIITDDKTKSVSSTIKVESDAIIIESVVVYLNISHGTRGDLDITLTSPQGTPSLLVPGNRPETTQGDQNWKLMTVRAWGESPVGDWTLSITDISPGDNATCQDSLWVTAFFGDDDLTTCIELDLLGYCLDGEAGPSFASTGLSSLDGFVDANGVSAATACCACGGGQAPASVTDFLHSWRIVMYGHDPIVQNTVAPTLAPVASTPAPVVVTSAPIPVSAAPVTAAPVDSGDSSPPPTGGFVAPCFSGHTTVTTPNGPLRMDQLMLGDKILTTNGYEAVYSFGHRSDDIKADFLQLLPSKLEISPQHMVFVLDGKAIPAAMIKVGDQLALGEVVSGIRKVTRQGVYAPFTASGTLMVNGVVASSYIAFQLDSHTFKGLTYQWMAHTFKAPHRMWCQYIDACLTEEYTEEGVSRWVEKGYYVGVWLHSDASFFGWSSVVGPLFFSALILIGTVVRSSIRIKSS